MCSLTHRGSLRSVADNTSAAEGRRLGLSEAGAVTASPTTTTSARRLTIRGTPLMVQVRSEQEGLTRRLLPVLRRPPAGPRTEESFPT
jgi:hypothetical protein